MKYYINEKGFTLLELIVVVVMIGIIMIIIFSPKNYFNSCVSKEEAEIVFTNQIKDLYITVFNTKVICEQEDTDDDNRLRCIGTFLPVDENYTTETLINNSLRQTVSWECNETDCQTIKAVDN